MRRRATLSNQPKWLVQPMKLRQIHVVVSWIDALEPYKEVDQASIAVRMKEEMIRARAAKSPQYIIGHVVELPAFFMIGFPLSAKENIPTKKLKVSRDYEILTFLINPILQKQLYRPVYEQAFKYLFDQHVIGRILLQIQRTDADQITILRELGFAPPLDYTTHNVTHLWYACKLSDFIH
jgi:hypothetical protein